MSILTYWVRAARLWAFPATLIPVLVGSFAPLTFGHAFRPGLFALALLGTLLLHAAANMLNDVDDHRRGVDRQGTFGGSRMIQEGSITPEDLQKAAQLTLALGILLGLAITAVAGWGVLWVGLFGAVSAVTYTTVFRFKYRAAGDLQIFLTFGPAVVLGAWYVQTGSFSWIPIALAFPVGMMTDAILHANNLRDIADDQQAGIRTMAQRMGREKSHCFYGFLVSGAYLSVVLLVLCGEVPVWGLLVLATWPLARACTNLVMSERELSREEFAGIDGRTAQLNLAFGLLFALAFLLERWI